jgi:hypothetical protein
MKCGIIVVGGGEGAFFTTVKGYVLYKTKFLELWLVPNLQIHVEIRDSIL